MHNLLEGVRVVETASYMMGPIAGRILADWGAEVIKIEPDVAHPPFDGDRIRGTGLARGIMNGDLGIYYFVNATRNPLQSTPPASRARSFSRSSARARI